MYSEYFEKTFSRKQPWSDECYQMQYFQKYFMLIHKDIFFL